jgi:hypothetical protein
MVVCTSQGPYITAARPSGARIHMLRTNTGPIWVKFGAQQLATSSWAGEKMTRFMIAPSIR